MKIIRPKLFEEVGGELPIIGRINKKELSYHGMVDRRLFTEYIDIDGKTFIGSTIYVHPIWNILIRPFWSHEFNQIDGELFLRTIGVFQKSQGLITLKISGHREDQGVYIPLLFRQFEPREGWMSDMLEKHKKVGQKIEQYKRDLKKYSEELSIIDASRKEKNGDLDPKYLLNQRAFLGLEIYKILEDSEDSFLNYEYADEDKKERELREKYKEALEWIGPPLSGLVSKFGVFELRVYSDDHDKHFHVIHRGKGINARFSFPDLRLMNYKNSRNTIKRKTEEAIREYCIKPEIFEEFEKQFAKRHE